MFRSATCSTCAQAARPRGRSLARAIGRHVDARASLPVATGPLPRERFERHAGRVGPADHGLVEPQRWIEQGGAGRIDIDGPQLLISQTPRVHHQIVVLLDKLRLARGKPATGTSTRSRLRSIALSAFGRAAGDARFGELRQPAELRSIVYELGQPAGVRMLVDWQSLAAAGCRPQSLVSLVVEKQPLAAALAQLLGPLELSYRIVAPQTIEITSTSALRARPELDVYPARQLLESAEAGHRPPMPSANGSATGCPR